jgi:pimeloyl-ACP methyl ester carboxylesterase
LPGYSARFVEVPEAGHALPQEAPATVAGLLEELTATIRDTA